MDRAGVGFHHRGRGGGLRSRRSNGRRPWRSGHLRQHGLRLACDAADNLAPCGVAARVVSVPCLELMLEQGDEFIESLVPDDGTPVAAIEAARGESFRGLVGRKGIICGIPRFGASAPYAALAEEFGFTPDAVAQRIKEFVEAR